MVDRRKRETTWMVKKTYILFLNHAKQIINGFLRGETNGLEDIAVNKGITNV
jgi:hypothetical protein